MATFGKEKLKMDEQISIFDLTLQPFSIDSEIDLIECFAGYGSTAMALRNLGAKFNHHRVYEIDKYAIASYNAVHNTDFISMDITQIHGVDFGINKNHCTILSYSFPCQDLSVAGLQRGMEKGSGTRSSLLWEVQRLLIECKDIGNLPNVLLLENVDAIVNQINKPHLMKWISFLDGLSYTSYGKILNANDYGIAQNRNRYFLVSLLGEYNYKFPKPMELTTCIEDYFEPMSEEQALKMVVKSQKAMDLMVDLDAENKLE